MLTGVMKEGDELVKINDIELSRMSIDDVCDLLASLTGRVHFLLRPKHTTHTKNGVGGGNPGSPMDTLEMLKASRTDTATSIFDEQVVSTPGFLKVNEQNEDPHLGFVFFSGLVLSKIVKIHNYSEN